MKRDLQSFDEKVYRKCKRELNSKNARKIVRKIRKDCGIRDYEQEFLSYFYSPILTVIKQFRENIKGKSILEIGHRIPMFLDYLKTKGALVCGIDITPLILNDYSLKISVENIPQKFMNKYKNHFDFIVARIILSRLYDEHHVLKTGKPRFRNKDKILQNLHNLLKSKGILILQDDRGTIFTEKQFKNVKFHKVFKETPIIFKDKNGKNKGWNVIVAYQK